MNPSLPPDLSSFVEQQVASGQFQSADEVVVAGLRLMRARQQKLEELRALIAEADESFAKGDFIDLDDASLGDFFEGIKAEARGERAKGIGRDESISDQS